MGLVEFHCNACGHGIQAIAGVNDDFDKCPYCGADFTGTTTKNGETRQNIVQTERSKQWDREPR